MPMMSILLPTVLLLTLPLTSCSQLQRYGQAPQHHQQQQQDNQQFSTYINPFLHPPQQQQQQQYQQQQPEATHSTPYLEPPKSYPPVLYPNYEQPTPLPSGPFVPAPPGKRPYCAKGGSTFCEKVEYYPMQLIAKLLDTGKYDGFLVNEETPVMPSYPDHQYQYHYNYTETRYLDYGYPSPSTVYVGPVYNKGWRGRRQVDVGDEEPLCPVRDQFVAAKAALNNKGAWKYVVNMPEMDSKYTQFVKTSTCLSSRCNGLCTPPTGSSSRCDQQYVMKRQLSLEANGQRLMQDVFLFPDCCLCKFRTPN